MTGLPLLDRLRWAGLAAPALRAAKVQRPIKVVDRDTGEYLRTISAEDMNAALMARQGIELDTVYPVGACPGCGEKKERRASTCNKCALVLRKADAVRARTCHGCGGTKTWNAVKCSGCLLSEHKSKRMCACGEPTSKPAAAVCRKCWRRAAIAAAAEAKAAAGNVIGLRVCKCGRSKAYYAAQCRVCWDAR